MSSAAQFAYQDVAYIKPFIGMNMHDQSGNYGDVIEIDCFYSMVNKTVEVAEGRSIFCKESFMTDYKKAKMLDLISLDGVMFTEVQHVGLINTRAIGDDDVDYVIMT